MRHSRLALLVLLVFPMTTAPAHGSLELVFTGAPPGVMSVTDTDGVLLEPDIDFAPIGAPLPLTFDVVFNPSTPPAVPPPDTWEMGIMVLDDLEISITSSMLFAPPGIAIVGPIEPIDPFGGFAGLFTYTGPVAPGAVIASFTVVPEAGIGIGPDDDDPDFVLFSGTTVFAPDGMEFIQDHIAGVPLPLGVPQGFDAQVVPEPSAFLALGLIACGVAGCWAWKHRYKVFGK